MKYIKIFFTLIIILNITGCYNYRELNDLGITTALGIEYHDGIYKLTIEVLKTDEENGGYVTFTQEGKTIQETLRKTILTSSKRLYANHLMILAIDSDLAKEGIKDILDLFFRDPESRKQFYVLISDDTEKLLNTETSLDSVNAKSLYERINVNKNYLGNVKALTFSNLLSKYVNPNIEIIVPIVRIRDDEITFEDTAIFKKDKLITTISNEETIYFNLIKGNIKDTILTNNDVSIEIDTAKTKYEISDNKIDIYVNLVGNIAEINKKVDLVNPKSIENIEKNFENDLNNKITQLIDKVTKYDIDIFGFKDLIYKYDYKNYNEDINLKDLNIYIHTDVKLRYKGNGAYELNER